MKKKLLLLSMISVMSLVGCGDVSQTTDNEGNQIIVKIGDTNYTANALFDDYSNTASGAQQYFNAVYNVLINAVQNTTTSIKNEVDRELDSFVEKANTSAKENGTAKSAELSKALEEAGVDDLYELEQVYLLDKKKEAYEDKFYDTKLNNELLEEYINTYAPYHIRHILVKTSSGDSLYDGTISSSDADNIADVVTDLASGKLSFGSIAKAHAENGDTSSAEQYGDVGIMSTTTSFVSEFKYAVYQYDALYNNAAKTNAQSFTSTRTIGGKTYEGHSLIPYTNDSTEVNLLKNSINRIDYSVFLDLKANANMEIENIKNNNYKETKYLPRNIIFNKYLNNHALGVIRKGDTDINSNRFQFVEGLSANTTDDKEKILCDETGRPILVTRAGTGSGDEGYQGIHFIIIQKSPFVKSASDKTLTEELKEYYDTESYIDNKELNTYVNFIKSTSTSEYTERADTIKTNIKSIDSYMNYRLYEQALSEAGTVEFIGSTENIDIEKLIKELIDSNRTTSAFSAKNDYETSWDKYIKLLKTQKQVLGLKVSEETNFKNKTITEIKNVLLQEAA